MPESQPKPHSAPREPRQLGRPYGGRWANRLASIEILSGDAGHVWRGGKVNDRLCARCRGYREKLGEPGDNREETAAFVAKARSDKARMQAIRGHLSPAQPPRKLASEQNVAELRATIGSDRSKVLG